MSVHSSASILIGKISEYKRKLYLNMLYKGILISLALILGTFLMFNFAEFFARFNSTIRAGLLFTWIALCIGALGFYIIRPVFCLWFSDPLTNETAAIQIGQFFPNIKDKLLNTLQLASNPVESDLLAAGIAQKTSELRLIKFADAINLSENKKYLKYILPLLLILILIGLFKPTILNSTHRIINYNKTFAEPAPFQFEILNNSLKGIKNEHFVLKTRLNGTAIPEEVFMVINDRKYKMEKEGNHHKFTISNLDTDTPFHLEAAGFQSNTYVVEISKRPALLSFNVNLTYPKYLNKPSEKLENVGNLIVPEGTVVKWTFNTDETDNLGIRFNNSKEQNIPKSFFSGFSFQQTIKKSAVYELSLKNKNIINKDKLSYSIDVIGDQYPQVKLEQLKDTSLYSYIGIGGSISDDYGISTFKLFYRNKSKNKVFLSINIPFNSTSVSQTYFQQINLDQLGLNIGEEFEYYLQVTDNDGTNGPKSTRTNIQAFKLPTSKEFNKQINIQSQKTENDFKELLKKSKEYKNKLDQLDNILKKKSSLDFQDKKQIEELINKKEELLKEIKELQEQINKLNEQQNRFDQQSESLQKKMEQLQNLLNDLLKSENEKVLEEIKKLLDNQQNDQALDKLEDLKRNERNIERNVDRTLKQFKKLEMEQKVNKAIRDLENLAEKQENLAEKTENKKQGQENESLQKEQEQLNENFEELKKELNEIEKDGEKLKKDIDTNKEEQNNTQQEQQNAQEKLKTNENKKAADAEKKAAKSMRNIVRKMMKSMDNGGEGEQLEIDMDAIRQIIENTIKISKDQEEIMKNFKSISISDPRFINLSRKQLDIGEEAKVIEDSLYSLAGRVLQIQSFVTKEVTAMKNNIDESIELIRERKLPIASVKQQFSMTSMNNLALMLSDTFKEMQSMGSGKGKGSKIPMPNPNPGLGEQQKGINKKIQGLGGQKQGKELSKELANLAVEQAKLRKQLEELAKKLNGTEQGKKIGNTLSELQKLMDESENDLINKRINPNLVRRQKEIETRLLEAEKAIKEQGLDPTRKANTASILTKKSAPELEKFKTEKLKQIELIRTTPPNFTPFYKKQTDNYFKRIN